MKPHTLASLLLSASVWVLAACTSQPTAGGDDANATPPADHVYQVWLIPPGGQPVGAGLSRPGEGGTQSIPIERSLADRQTVAITLEPAGGSPGPTTPVLAVATL